MRYQDFDFKVLRTPTFDIYYYPEEEEAVRVAAILSERWDARISRVLGHNLTDRQPLILYAGHPHFRQTNATPGEVGETTGGFTELFKRRVVMPFAGPMAETDHVLGHELVHAFQFDIGSEIRAPGPPGAATLALPLWFIEGMAEYLSLGAEDAFTSMWMRDALLHDKLPTLKRIGRPEFFPYRFGHAFWAYVGGRWGDEVIGRMLRTAAESGDPMRAIRQELEIEPEAFSEQWHAALQEQFGPALEASRPAAEHGRLLLEARRWVGRLNVSPSLSPDGRHLVFFSERDLFSIELYLMDVERGEIVRRITRTVTDPHFDSLQFMASTGTWSPDGSRFAISGIGRGKPTLTIIDPFTGDELDQFRFDELVEIFQPAWSPDGRRMMLSTNTSGFTDLYLLDLETRELRRLTDDSYAALQPAWSPDGQRIAFVTDRFTTDLEQLVFGDYRLALLDPDTGAIEALPGFEDAKNTNPQWSPDGRHLYFLSDVRGTTNLYRLAPGNGTIEEWSDLQTGISGISRLSPALSVSGDGAGGEKVAVSIFEEGRYHLYLFDNLEAREAVTAPHYRTLPPAERAFPLLEPLLHDPIFPPGQIEVQDPERYRPRISLDSAVQPSIGAGTSSIGNFVGGGIGLLWSDMLGDHNLLTLFELEGDSDTLFRNLVAVANYENRKRRWTWGVAGGQVPLRSAFFRLVQEPNGDLVQELFREWQINRELSGRVAYPFSRADRVEFFGGLRHISFALDVQRLNLNTGQFETRRLDAPDSLLLGTTGAALVHDTTVFGGAGPVMGRRHRFELGGVVGDLNYFAPLADYRHYVMPIRPVTLAGRMLHFGRYGSGGEDRRLSELFIGNPGLVRGYLSGSFRLRECPPPPAQDCPVFDNLLGSRIAVANAEVRLPLTGPLGLARTPRMPTIETAVFYDYGVAWTSDDRARIFGGDRRGVRSYGASIRLGLWGILVLNWNYVQPIDRPDKDWHWEFTIMPSF